MLIVIKSKQFNKDFNNYINKVDIYKNVDDSCAL